MKRCKIKIMLGRRGCGGEGRNSAYSDSYFSTFVKYAMTEQKHA
jgi:hypothetical protein